MSDFEDTVCSMGFLSDWHLQPFFPREMGFWLVASFSALLPLCGKIQILLKLHKYFLEGDLEVSLSSNSICPIDLHLHPFLVSIIVYFQRLVASCRQA